MLKLGRIIAGKALQGDFKIIRLRSIEQASYNDYYDLSDVAALTMHHARFTRSY